jgi:hypothetical protein
MLSIIKDILYSNARMLLRSYQRMLTVPLRRFVISFNLTRSAIKNRNIANTTIVIDEVGVHYTCGYYDVSPFYPIQKSLLLFRTKAPYKPLTKRYVGEVGYVDFSDDSTKEFIPLEKTDTWCWQQGCRLQWLPRAEGKLALFNKCVSLKPGVAIIDVKSGLIQREIDSPVYAAHPNGQDAITLDFVRLGRMRPGYGYVGFSEDDKDCLAPANNGLWKLSLITGERELLLSLAELSLLKPVETMRGSTHYINHVSFNPSGSRLLFIHLWTNRSYRFGRLITMNPDGSELTVLNNEGHASHYTWRNDNEILHYSTHADEGTGYYLYTDISGSRKKIGNNILTEDGHPTFIGNKNSFIIDTYPDKYGDQLLFRFDMIKNSTTVLGRFYHPPQYFDEVRCDLHPRLNDDYDKFAIDFIKNKHRAVCIGQLSRIL